MKTFPWLFFLLFTQRREDKMKNRNASRIQNSFCWDVAELEFCRTFCSASSWIFSILSIAIDLSGNIFGLHNTKYGFSSLMTRCWFGMIGLRSIASRLGDDFGILLRWKLIKLERNMNVKTMKKKERKREKMRLKKKLRPQKINKEFFLRYQNKVSIETRG